MGFTPYLFFSGTCRQAFTRYHELFGGDLVLLPMADAPEGEGMPGTSPDSIMHAALTLADGAFLYASDDPTGDGSGVKGIAVHWSAGDETDARRVFDALAEGGEVQMPLEPTFWSPLYGACVDRWGVSWMVDVAAEQV